MNRNCIKYAKKSKKLSKSGKLKSEKTSKFLNLAKSGNKLSKSGNLANFSTIEAGTKFLTLDIKIIFNRL